MLLSTATLRSLNSVKEIFDFGSRSKKQRSNQNDLVSFLYDRGFDKWSTALLRGAVHKNTLKRCQETRSKSLAITLGTQECFLIPEKVCELSSEMQVAFLHPFTTALQHCSTVIKVLEAPELKLVANFSSTEDPCFSVDCRQQGHCSDQDELEVVRRPEVRVRSCGSCRR